ncbi:uncharacterized protein LOC113500012 isoform X2 [Trichoplusia ni]|uniref:Uncharacterized protein LOC113500012 isoform X2 n=1 Tax=Trichoplusia ni TaxID=7111 RepID=A0A7E5W7I8_TRINI|nr:uncharacterized protein LOC113500012 isoform X2 [Trichoplusia ni]
MEPSKQNLGFMSIYRLKFYKNKKDWKLSSDVKKPLPKSESESEGQMEMDCEPEPSFKQCLDEELGAHEEPEPVQSIKADAPGLGNNVWTNRQWTEQRPAVDHQAAMDYQRAMEYLDAAAALDPKDFALPDTYEPLQPQIQRPPEQNSQRGYRLRQQLELSSLGDSLARTEQWLQRRGYKDLHYDQPVGAEHIAPNSLEVDLSIDEQNVLAGCPCVAGLPPGPEAVSRLVRSLRNILEELIRREALGPPMHYVTREEYDEHLTRASDPSYTLDPVIAGSHLAVPSAPSPTPSLDLPCTPRGRGRLLASSLNMDPPCITPGRGFHMSSPKKY